MEERGFAGAARPHDRDEFSLFYAKRNALERAGDGFLCYVLFFEVLYIDHFTLRPMLSTRSPSDTPETTSTLPFWSCSPRITGCRTARPLSSVSTNVPSSVCTMAYCGRYNTSSLLLVLISILAVSPLFIRSSGFSKEIFILYPTTPSVLVCAGST